MIRTRPTAIRLDHTALMHPTLHRAPFTRAGWILEHKLDGFRALARTGRDAALLSRNGLSYAAAFPEIIAALRRVDVAAVLDCELVVVDGSGCPQWERLRRRAVIRRAGAPQVAAAVEPASLYAFDLLAIDNRDFRELPLLERKERLAALLAGTSVHYVEHLEAHGEAFSRRYANSTSKASSRSRLIRHIRPDAGRYGSKSKTQAIRGKRR